MRALFWLLAVFAAAAGLALLGRLDQGYVQFAHGHWRVEMSLLLFGILVALLFAAWYLVLRLLQQTVSLPGFVRAWRARRRREHAYAALAEGLQAWLEGRYTRARRSRRRAPSRTARRPGWRRSSPRVPRTSWVRPSGVRSGWSAPKARARAAPGCCRRR